MDHFTQLSNYTTPKCLSSVDKKSSNFLVSINLSTPDGNKGKLANTSVPTPQQNALELMKGSCSNTGSIVVEKPHAHYMLQEVIDASTQTDIY